MYLIESGKVDRDLWVAVLESNITVFHTELFHSILHSSSIMPISLSVLMLQ